MLKIGITGGIGSGKSTACKVFEILGIPVFYADDVAKQIMVIDPLLKSQVKDTFGVESYLEDGSVNRKYLAQIVFNNEQELQKLNKLVHPAVFRAFDNWALGLTSKAPYLVKEAALLFESDSYKMCDQNILVTAPLEVKINRVMQRDHVSREEVEARMSKQWTDEEKIKLANFIIYNDEQHSVISQVLELHEIFRKG
ncbi:dephospho-CoA kinase [Pedobacter flavus]|uniref:Dephospho-CoA kinase n=1 Tax=Pedobacter flavus TaxID=3113906 RepID=A0ABU7H2I1_9SPHI|nr:dephospho-CoA kinase [Pedobacter sp. VNH31]MEE1885233.1 dephospho-CoA kinase [Pedobacter sp. VNH31]